MKSIVLIFFTLFVVFQTNAQLKNKNINFKFDNKNVVSISVGGQGIIYSLGYERILVNKKIYKLSGSINGSYYPLSANLFSQLIVPITLNNIFSYGKHHVEIGLGVIPYKKEFNSIIFDNKYIGERYYTSTIAYRHQKNNSKLMYKIAFTPILEVGSNYKEIHPLGGIIVGYTF